MKHDHAATRRMLSYGELKKYQILAESLIVGLIVGLVIVLHRIILSSVFSLFKNFYSNFKISLFKRFIIFFSSREIYD